MTLEQLLLRLLSIPSTSGQEQEVARFCAGWLSRHGFRVEVDDLGNVAAKRGKGKLLALVAHLDDRGHPEKRYWELDGDIVVSGTGYPLGGDDKCGVAIALHCAGQVREPVAVLLTVQEEIGGRGCEYFVSRRREWLEEVSSCLVLDRRGEADVVTHIGGISLDPGGSFKSLVIEAARELGLLAKEVSGSFSDAFTLQVEAGLSVVNISVGYHNPHTADEKVSLTHLRQSWDWVKTVSKLLKEKKEKRPRSRNEGQLLFKDRSRQTTSGVAGGNVEKVRIGRVTGIDC